LIDVQQTLIRNPNPLKRTTSLIQEKPKNKIRYQSTSLFYFLNSIPVINCNIQRKQAFKRHPTILSKLLAPGIKIIP
jgi:hypothetical protein